MGGGPSGDPTVEEMASEHPVLANRHRHFVRVHLGGSFEKKDRESRDGRFPIHFTTEWRTTTSSIADGQRKRILQYDTGTMVRSARYPAFSMQGDMKALVVK